ncbi:MAG: TIGR00725 family protein [Dehalococcoidia bacterium]|tara:strand:- start:167 stop:637 length:471 start_codon:yes stop_codon:yes gene_type:complete
MIVSVIGESSATTQNENYAFEVGRLLAKSNLILACGGLGGVMEAACKGAKSEGGTTIGILPGINISESNQWIDIPICTGLGYARNVIVARTGIVAIAIGGAYGTLSEIAYALAEDKPVIGLNTWELMKNNSFDNKIIRAQNANEAVEKALEQILDK